MREWLVLELTRLIQRLLGSRQPSGSSAEAASEEPPAEEEKKCPICGEEWEKGEIFCYHCGYELRDEEIPLHPPPQRTGALTDPDGILAEADRTRLGDAVSSIAVAKGWDIAVLILPRSLSERSAPGPDGSPGFSLEGLSYGLYNTWRMGMDTGLKGMLLVIDPDRQDRTMVLGRNGPRLSGQVFREWYSEYPPPPVGSDRASFLAAELDYLMRRIEGV